MKKHFAQFYAFITEQQSWFEQHLAADFEQSWDDPVWVCGSNGSGWLRGNGKNKLRFDEIGRTKGIEGRHAVAEDYARFMKALLVLVYRRRNRSISPAVAVATLMILKRWYHSLFEVTGQTHPVYLTTGVIQRSMDNLSAASSLGDPNTANYKGRCVSLQKLVNHQSFTLVTLQYVSDGQYTNQTNLTRKAREAGLLASTGSTGDSYDNAMAESINGLYKAEVIHRKSWKNRAEVELATLTWVDWYNNRRLLERLGHTPPAEAEKAYYASIGNDDLAA